MKYKVGDKVKVINDVDNYFDKGDIVRIVEIDDSLVPYRCLRLKDDKSQWLNEEDFELVKYTWEDFLEAPIGTKVTFENGKYLFKCNKDEFGDEFTNLCNNYSYQSIKSFERKLNDYGKIIKIEEPTYLTVYELKEVTMLEIEEMKRLTDELYKTCDEFIKKIKEKEDE